MDERANAIYDIDQLLKLENLLDEAQGLIVDVDNTDEIYTTLDDLRDNVNNLRVGLESKWII